MQSRIALAALLLLPNLVFAQGPWGELNVGYGTYSMADLNDTIGEINYQAAGNYLDEVKGGVLYGLNFGYQLGIGLGFGFGYERLNGGTEYSDPHTSYEINVPANVFKGLVEYHLPSTTKTSKFLVGEIGLLSSAGDGFRAVGGRPRIVEDYEGSALYAAAAFGVAVPINSEVWIDCQAGFRYAKIGEVKNYHITLTSPDGSKLTHDYSGLFLRIGFRSSISSPAGK